MEIAAGKSLVLFDGFCHLCSRTVQLILRFDKQQHFVFSPLSSETGKHWQQKLAIPKDIDSVILIEDDRYFIQSEAAFRIAKRLGGIFKLAQVFRIIPQKWADQLYDWIAKNRFRWFGRRKSCLIPDPQDKQRFI